MIKKNLAILIAEFFALKMGLCSVFEMFINHYKFITN